MIATQLSAPAPDVGRLPFPVGNAITSLAA